MVCQHAIVCDPSVDTLQEGLQAGSASMLNGWGMQNCPAITHARRHLEVPLLYHAVSLVQHQEAQAAQGSQVGVAAAHQLP